MKIKRLLAEPLVHFLLLGAALFAAFSFLPEEDAPRESEIIVSAGKIEHLAALFARTWQRPPTREELDGLINDFVREEVACREGMAVGLDRDDTIIRRRIRQKFEFIAEDLASQIEPSDDELAAYLEANADQFRVDPRFTFRHVYLNPEQRGDSVENDARDLLIALNGDPQVDAGNLGDRILLEHGYADVSLRDVDSLFGKQFAAAIGELQPGMWHGPIASGYGVHLVLIDDRTDGRIPMLAEIRDVVRREWDNARRVETIEKFYGEMIDRYELVIEWPALGPREEGS